MNTTRRIILATLFISFLLIATWMALGGRERAQETRMIQETTDYSTAFASGGLRTNTDVASIPLERVLSGTPYRDNIPAINEPSFLSIDEARDQGVTDERGIVVTVGDTTRFYPFNIMVWHEIVNDIIEDQPLVVTFCPLCGSTVVFDARVDDQAQQFGVSGKLFESNLLMYDGDTHSLWSQILGEAMVGTHTGKTLAVYPSQVMPFDEFVSKHPTGEVLSRNTGHIRDYSLYPYGDYETNERILFPVSVSDTRLPAKEIMYIVDVGDTSFAFHHTDLREAGEAVMTVDGETITASVEDSEVTVTTSDGAVVPGYYAMWFSWATHHQDDGVVWQAE